MILNLLWKIWRLLQSSAAKQDEILARLDEIKDILTPQPAVKITFTANLDGVIQTGVENMTLRDDQQVGLSIAITDRKGNAAQVDGVPVWAGSDDTVITVTPAADGMSANVVGVAPGSARVVVTADADLGAGTTDLTGTLDFDVTAGGATSITITPGTPTDQ